MVSPNGEEGLMEEHLGPSSDSGVIEQSDDSKKRVRVPGDTPEASLKKLLTLTDSQKGHYNESIL